MEEFSSWVFIELESSCIPQVTIHAVSEVGWTESMGFCQFKSFLLSDELTHLSLQRFHFQVQ